MSMMHTQDERDIIAVILRYGDAIDRRDWSLFSSCFTADVVAEYGIVGRWQGRESITRSMDELHRTKGPTLHRMSNFMIAGDSRQATARTYVDAILMPLDAEGKAYQGIGYYDDELIKTPDGWQIARRQFTLVHRLTH